MRHSSPPIAAAIGPCQLLSCDGLAYHEGGLALPAAGQQGWASVAARSVGSGKREAGSRKPEAETGDAAGSRQQGLVYARPALRAEESGPARRGPDHMHG